MLFLAVFSSLVYSTVGADLQGALNDVWDFTESYLLSVWQNRFYVYTTAAVLIGVWFIVNMLFKKSKTVNPVNPWPYKSAKKQELSPVTEKVIHVSGVKVFYGSQTGTAKGFAKELAEDVSTQGIQCEVIDMKEYDPDDRLAEEEELMESSSDAESSAEEEKSHGSVIDMEDLGNVMNRMKKAKRMEGDEEESQRVKLSKQNGVRKSETEEERREMITPALRDALTKQGYKLIGSHSGVKLCRWTKSMLRGRGGCYKHTFYGIESHRCMETTPSLACANKCVFCWRHHTNPVGTEWRWKMDPAEKIIQEAMENHRNMIRQFRGVPGVRPERFEEGLTVKHCALSLVGEPIMYPEINTFLRLLHQQNISSFLVTNAQFPEEIRNLVPVTQLYVSVDASTKDSLKKIDRPLFKDFWQRFLDSLRALGEKQQRTVYRLTLVKAWNVDELKAYSDLIALGQPDFIEVKGVTYCGESSASSLTMANVPWHEEVIYFVQQLANLLPNYEIACEHEHSNCLLLAHHKFKVDGEWWTWIDYERFQELIQEYDESGGTTSFSAMDYMAKTPSWAIFGARERGFDPLDTRFQRKNKTKDISGC
ncbi:S-adenosyl-L-methionine-dependent tRNA 4-demethylwyosine synthase TYW1 isoform X2 [Rhinichthys klamathensis goyatoka]|uniref:S-adenosyl-L-methionine-dependent tRNA 4-demethylwyosine synthase TYW1 isoform X2 n=1 Tax=Rhinichthys klamathensis goyatoka TaxID=3034132 RepID=UPI0024B4BFA2|nr:S-adenosyl-L-methionine-dependent tRNA 4-demethylwyosine synthase TYW1 isoform X2 [Rhinichthys klamathensis goyatoka]